MLVPPSPMPPIHHVGPAPSNLAVIDARPGAITCGGVRVQPVGLERPFPATYGAWSGMPPLAPNRFRFRIDAAGHPAGITRDQDPRGFLPNRDDMAAALAASRFPAGQPRANCTIAYDAGLAPIAQASPRLLAELVTAPEVGNTQEAWDLLTADGTCRKAPPGPRAIHYPSFERVPQPTGTRGWTFLRFDVDARGRTRAVHVAYSSGNAALDRAGAAALRANRYAPGHAVTGCAYHFYLKAEHPQPAPEMPPDAPAGSTGTACDLDPKSVRGLFNGDAYPQAFRTRHIEGYAIIGFDTASWGAIGNVVVLASEPAEQFGQAAWQAILHGRVTPSDHGQRGCVQRVRFRLPFGQ